MVYCEIVALKIPQSFIKKDSNAEMNQGKMENIWDRLIGSIKRNRYHSFVPVQY